MHRTRSTFPAKGSYIFWGHLCQARILTWATCVNENFDLGNVCQAMRGRRTQAGRPRKNSLLLVTGNATAGKQKCCSWKGAKLRLVSRNSTAINTTPGKYKYLSDGNIQGKNQSLAHPIDFHDVCNTMSP